MFPTCPPKTWRFIEKETGLIQDLTGKVILLETFRNNVLLHKCAP